MTVLDATWCKQFKIFKIEHPYSSHWPPDFTLKKLPPKNHIQPPCVSWWVLSCLVYPSPTLDPTNPHPSFLLAAHSWRLRSHQTLETSWQDSKPLCQPLGWDWVILSHQRTGPNAQKKPTAQQLWAAAMGDICTKSGCFFGPSTSWSWQAVVVNAVSFEAGIVSQNHPTKSAANGLILGWNQWILLFSLRFLQHFWHTQK